MGRGVCASSASPICALRRGGSVQAGPPASHHHFSPIAWLCQYNDPPRPPPTPAPRAAPPPDRAGLGDNRLECLARRAHGGLCPLAERPAPTPPFQPHCLPPCAPSVGAGLCNLRHPPYAAFPVPFPGSANTMTRPGAAQPTPTRCAPPRPGRVWVIIDWSTLPDVLMEGYAPWPKDPPLHPPFQPHCLPPMCAFRRGGSVQAGYMASDDQFRPSACPNITKTRPGAG